MLRHLISVITVDGSRSVIQCRKQIAPHIVNTYINDIEQMGINDAVAIAQTAYDRYMAG